MALALASIWYRERAGLAPTRRGPSPAIAPGLNPVHTYPVSPPHPLPFLLEHTQGSPPPDRGLSEVWPHGVESESAQ